jgi:hypothetical protein
MLPTHGSHCIRWSSSPPEPRRPRILSGMSPCQVSIPRRFSPAAATVIELGEPVSGLRGVAPAPPVVRCRRKVAVALQQERLGLVVLPEASEADSQLAPTDTRLGACQVTLPVSSQSQAVQRVDGLRVVAALQGALHGEGLEKKGFRLPKAAVPALRTLEYRGQLLERQRHVRWPSG